MILARWAWWAVSQPFRGVRMAHRAVWGLKRRKIAVGLSMLGKDKTYYGHLEDYDDIVQACEEANAVLNQAGVRIDLFSVVEQNTPDWVKEISDDGTSYDRPWRYARQVGTWMQRNLVPEANLTIFLLYLRGKRGYAISRTSFISIDPKNVLNGRGDVIAHEIGHMADLMHTNDPARLMKTGRRDDTYRLTRWERLAINTAPFTEADC